MKKLLSVILALTLMLALVACGNAAPADTDQTDTTEQPTATFEIAALKGPTAIGIVNMMAAAELNNYKNTYNITVYGTADEVLPKIVKGEINAACVPANVAAVLYNKTSGGIQVAAINTLSVLYVVETGDSVQSVADLKGKTIYSTGKGTTPEYSLNYILEKNGLDPAKDVTVEFKSEATEIAALLAEGYGDMIAVLPQPYVTVAASKAENLRVALSLGDEWAKVADDGSSLVTGVLIINKAFAEENPEATAQFLADYKQSVETATAEVTGTANLCENYDIFKAAIAEKAIPQCNIQYIDGDAMKTALSGYLNALYEQNPDSIGGALVGEDFWYAQQ